MLQLTCAVIIATRNRPDWLSDTLVGLAECVADRVLVVDQSDAPFRAQNQSIVRDLDWVDYVDSPIDGLPASRNRGLAQTTESVVVFLDDDVKVAPGCVAAHVQAYQDPKIGAVVGRIVEKHVKVNRSSTGNSMSMSGRMRTNLEGTRATFVDAVKGANMSFRRAALEEIGVFDDGYLGTAYLEEVDISERLRRANWSIRFEPKAEVIHFAAPAGGVRVGSSVATERWRFQNTGYFLGKHRSVFGALMGGVGFGAVACKRVVEYRELGVGPRLLKSMYEGWRRGRAKARES